MYTTVIFRITIAYSFGKVFRLNILVIGGVGKSDDMYKTCCLLAFPKSMDELKQFFVMFNIDKSVYIKVLWL